jgi:hypothetical protein
VLACAAKQHQLDLVLRRSRETVAQLFFSGQTLAYPRHHALMKAFRIVWRLHHHVATGCRIGQPGLRSRMQLGGFEAIVVDQAQHCLFEKSGGARGATLFDLLIDHALKLVGKLSYAH